MIDDVSLGRLSTMRVHPLCIIIANHFGTISRRNTVAWGNWDRAERPSRESTTKHASPLLLQRITYIYGKWGTFMTLLTIQSVTHRDADMEDDRTIRQNSSKHV